jgi:hypothetical protein
MGILLSELLLRVSDKGLAKTEEKLRSWGKLSTLMLLIELCEVLYEGSFQV